MSSTTAGTTRALQTLGDVAEALMKTIGLGVLILIAVASVADAQGLRPVRATRGNVGLSFLVAQPVGEFANFVNVGAGLAGHGVWTPDPGGLLGLRADASCIIYGSETRHYGLVPLVDVGVTTDNLIAGLQIGPQITLGRGNLQAYGYGQLGFSYFGTTSSVDGGYINTTNYDDVTFATAAGAGLRLQLSHGRHPIAMDLGARYLHNGHARYLTEGSIRVTGNSVFISPIESQANLVVYQVGVTVGLR
jgi:hypothetical protein